MRRRDDPPPQDASNQCGAAWFLAAIRDLKRNTRLCAEHWVREGMPDPVPWDEHHTIAERLRDLRAALRGAPPGVVDVVREQVRYNSSFLA